MADGMVQAGHLADEDEAFARYLNEGRDPGSAPSALHRGSHPVIAEAGGVSVIAHPHDTRRGPGITDERFAELKRIGLNGIEVDHQSHPTRVRQELRQVAADLDLPATGSSDHHGNRRSGYNLGCNTTDPDAAAALLGERHHRALTATPHFVGRSDYIRLRDAVQVVPHLAM